MGVDNFSGKFGLIVFTLKPETRSPQYDRDEQ
jgi:hypothetical protein